MNKKVVIIISVIAALLIVGTIFVSLGRQEQSSVSGQRDLVNISYSNFAQEAAKQSVIASLPDESAISIKFYSEKGNYDSVEKSYSVSNNEIREGNLENADLTIYLYSKYMDDLTNHNFCQVLTAARLNGDMFIETRGSQASLAWKYRSAMKHRGCLGF